jgi:hypothetical protein
VIEKLAVGDKYLVVQLAGHISVSAFKNKNKKGNQPDFKGDGVAVWVNTKKAPVVANQAPKVTEEDLF